MASTLAPTQPTKEMHQLLQRCQTYEEMIIKLLQRYGRGAWDLDDVRQARGHSHRTVFPAHLNYPAGRTFVSDGLEVWSPQAEKDPLSIRIYWYARLQCRLSQIKDLHLEILRKMGLDIGLEERDPKDTVMDVKKRIEMREYRQSLVGCQRDTNMDMERRVETREYRQGLIFQRWPILDLMEASRSSQQA